GSARRSRPAIVDQFSDRYLQGAAVGKDHRALDEILQFANITRPMPPRKLLHRRDRDGLNLLLHAATVLLGEVADQKRNIFGALPQRRDANRKNIKAIIKIATELSVFNHFVEV